MSRLPERVILEWNSWRVRLRPVWSPCFRAKFQLGLHSRLEVFHVLRGRDPSRQEAVYRNQSQRRSSDELASIFDPWVVDAPILIDSEVVFEMLWTSADDSAVYDAKHCNITSGGERCKAERHQSCNLVDAHAL